MDSEYSTCGPDDIGRHWLEFSCRGSLGPASDPGYLNHRTGELRETSRSPAYADLDYKGLARPVCAPVNPDELYPWLDMYEPPFALEFNSSPGATVSEIGLRRCGRERTQPLSRCRYGQCVSPQLASGYVTWGEDERVIVYVPRTRKRVVLRAPEEALGYFLPHSVAHTCNRVFAQWGSYLYVARVKPRWGGGQTLCKA
jgi:hypothetical protein